MIPERDAANRGRTYERLVRNRSILLAVHLLLGSAMALDQLIHSHFERFVYWRAGSGYMVLGMISVPVAPFVISAVHSRPLVSDRTRPLVAFIATLVVGTIAAALLNRYLIDLDVGAIGLLFTAVAECFAYYFAADFFLGDEDSGYR